ncbi:helix-turn-helix domain-containing protein [Enterococcus sp. 669A]|uniref:Helix-turn-helix domain-containing protein n=1 Tax=Candidatus Enterococcus moelleringii TaxID=2815325 RepID=A0ABS3L510_9ENTE|nr:helix-turn-helix domain-containing protein [Enterococcus sp. 669A]MBO1304670.1 helix-turn-helix domain-containing protein [Enterococcus sp. 669A]
MDFRDILGTSSKRRLQLIEQLYYNRDGLPSDQLMSELDCSLPILLDDVRLVNEKNDYFHIEKYKGLYRLSMRERVSIGNLYAETLINSQEFQIIEQLLYEECDNITNLADRLYLSVSNTQRYLKKVKFALEKAGMYLRYRPLRIEGKESVIRHFYYRYFVEKQNAFENILPMMKDFQFNSIEQFVVEFIEENNLYRKYIFQKRLIYTIYVSLWRVKNGHTYPTSELRNKGFILPDQENYDEFNKTANDLFQVELTDGVIRDCMWLIYGDAVVFSNAHREMALADNLRYQTLYHQHYELAEEFNKLLGGKMDQQALVDMTTVLMNDFYLYDRNGAFVSILRRSRDTFLEMTAIMYQKPIVRVSEIVRKFVNKYGMYRESDFVMNYVYLLLTAEVNSLEMLVEQDDPIRLLLLSDLTPTEETFLAKHIGKIISGNFEISYFENVVDRKQGMYLEMLNYDGLITTGSVDGVPEDFPVVVMDPYVTPKALVVIQNLVNELSLNKELGL